MNKDNIQELLKPRYLVNTPWFPSNNYQSGDIVTPDKFTGWHPKDYPVIFRRLDWWEYLDVKDMPGYVKCIKTPDNFHFPDRVYRINYLNGIAYSDISIAVVFETNCYLPATETEYLNQTNHEQRTGN